MPLRLEDKQAVVTQVNEVAAAAQSAIAAEYRGLTVEQMTSLRAEMRKADVFLKVVKNTLARRAIEGTAFECMSEGLEGPLLLAFSKEDPGSAARVLKRFVKDHEKLVVKLVVVDGQLLPSANLDVLANLPTREQALGMLAGVIKAPITKLVRTLVEPPAKVARALAAYRDKNAAN